MNRRSWLRRTTGAAAAWALDASALSIPAAAVPAAASKRFGLAGVGFPVGVEYYRAPTPKPECWDGDFARLRRAGFRIVRSQSYWNWMEPQPGRYALDDFDRLFDAAAKHGLFVWLDVMLATHGACPEWLTRQFPDLAVVNHRGERLHPFAGPAFPQGGMIHCYDHPAWRQYGGALLRHVVRRYRDRPNLLVWGLWDGINLAAAWSPQTEGYPCYCEHTVGRYRRWLEQHFTLESLNTRLDRRYRSWDEVAPPRSKQAVVEMLLYRYEFHYQNLVEHLRWMVGEVEALDPVHELRAHGAWFPRPWDEACAAHVDSWGMSMASNNLLTSDDPYRIAARAFSFDCARSLGRNGRWWHEEIYAGMSPGGVTWKKQTDPRELTTLLWLALAGGAAGALFWQYRPEYLSFESPGYNLVALDGKPTARFEAVAAALTQIEGLAPHLPLGCPRARVAIVYHPASQELFDYGNESERYLADLRGVYRTLLTQGIPADVVTPRMAWSDYELIFLPNLALMDADARKRIDETLRNSPRTHLVAEGSFGLYSADGRSSYRPPEGFADRLGMRIADLSSVTEHDIAGGANVLESVYGPVRIVSPCGYAVLEPSGATRAIASLDGRPVALRTGDARFTWFGLTLSAGFRDVGQPELVAGLARERGIEPPVRVAGDRVVPLVRRSRAGGSLLFVFNLELRRARAGIRPPDGTASVTDLLTGRKLAIDEGNVALELEPGAVAVLHCSEG